MDKYFSERCKFKVIEKQLYLCKVWMEGKRGSELEGYRFIHLNTKSGCEGDYTNC